MNKKVRFITEAAMIAAIYTVLCIVLKPISYGAIQVRIAEALCILPIFTPAGVPGVTIGCLLANILGGADILDIIFGTLATLAGACGTYAFRKHRFIGPVFPIVANTIVIPFVLRYAYMDESSIPFLMLTIGGGEILSCGVLGILLMQLLWKFRSNIFPNS